ncbi:MAG: hypothetical protein HY302_01755 [Opitutae bacterium]|nr:hypothetical protein [Opitutae bacterium]
MDSDWKKFRQLVPILRERYLAERNRRIARTLTDAAKTETERFWDAQEVMEKEAVTLRRCLDGHSRSSMWGYLVEMRIAGMLEREDLAGFSEELRKQVFNDGVE